MDLLSALLGLLRHVLTFLGGWLVAKGIVDEGTANELIGALLSILAIAGSFLNKKNQGESGNGV